MAAPVPVAPSGPRGQSMAVHHDENRRGLSLRVEAVRRPRRKLSRTASATLPATSPQWSDADTPRRTIPPGSRHGSPLQACPGHPFRATPRPRSWRRRDGLRRSDRRGPRRKCPTRRSGKRRQTQGRAMIARRTRALSEFVRGSDNFELSYDPGRSQLHSSARRRGRTLGSAIHSAGLPQGCGESTFCRCPTVMAMIRRKSSGE